jgi:epoxyqueuosine reductase
MNETAKELKTLFRQSNIPVFGVTNASSLENEPSGYRPSDMLSSAESILCMGVPLPRGIFSCQGKSEDLYWRAANVYYRYIDSISLRAASIIEERGELAVPVFGCFPYEVKGKGDFWGYVSLVRMAEAAGLGKAGKNGLIFSSRYGPRLLLGGIVTTASLEKMAWPERDEEGCPEHCFVCQEHCPAGAIDKTGKVDRLACLTHSMRSPIFSYFMRTREIEPEEVQMINHVTGVDDHSMYTCINCVALCPYL